VDAPSNLTASPRILSEAHPTPNFPQFPKILRDRAEISIVLHGIPSLLRHKILATVHIPAKYSEIQPVKDHVDLQGSPAKNLLNQIP